MLESGLRFTLRIVDYVDDIYLHYANNRMLTKIEKNSLTKQNAYTNASRIR